jgi:alpha-glucoside transport system permease protein
MTATIIQSSSRVDVQSVPSRLANTIRRGPIHLILLAICLIWMTPAAGLLVSSFRPANKVATTGWWTAFDTPWNFTLENYQEVLTARGMDISFANSLLISVPATIMTVLIAAYAAYAFAWMRFPGRDMLFIVIVSLLVVPLQMTLVPLLRLFRALDITGTFLAIWLAHTGFGLPFAIYLLRGPFGALPGEMFEAAYIDGASPFTAFYRLALPTSLPAIASLAIFEFMWVWNDLLSALIFLGGRKAVAPMTVSISNLVSSQGEGWQLLTAAAFISMLLPLTIFFSLQRYFVHGIVAGSVKG